jgi:hypothetical protein
MSKIPLEGNEAPKDPPGYNLGSGNRHISLKELRVQEDHVQAAHSPLGRTGRYDEALREIVLASTEMVVGSAGGDGAWKLFQ